MTPTTQQQEISQSKVNTLVVRAYAGTGKTSTLILYAKANPTLRMIYLCFNASVKKEAETKFPSNVKCMTAHGAAFYRFGSTYANTPNKLNNPKPFHLSNAMGMTHNTADVILKIINTFMASVDGEITTAHAAQHLSNKNELKNGVKAANEVWEVMKDVRDLRIPMPHDGYLKLFQISGGVLNADVILFDESQDASPIMLAIVNASKARKVFVGDENQSIYGFRGAVNAMDDIVADEELYLTASFRFGAGVAYLANTVLNQYKKLQKPLEGLGKRETEFQINGFKKHTRLSRTNAMLFGEAVKCLRAERKFGFVGPVFNYGFDAIVDTYNLSRGLYGSIKDPVIKNFKTFADMQAYAEMVDDKELKSKIKIVEEYQNEIPALVEQVKSKAQLDLNLADIILTTAHKSKGLEWDSVYLTDDFTTMLEKEDEDSKGKLLPPEPEEINLLYVAITRAERCISVHPGLFKWLEQVEFFDPIFDRYEGIPRLSPEYA